MNTVVVKRKIQAMPVVWRGIRMLVLSPVRGYFRYFPVLAGKRRVWRSVARHVRWLESWATAKTLFGRKLLVDPQDDVGRCIYYFGIWEPNLTAWISRSLSAGDTFIDVGANVGYFSLLASGIVGERGHVVSIEAMPRTCDLLSENVRLNGIRNARVVPIAVWDTAGSIELFGPRQGISGTASALKNWADRWDHTSKITVPCAPLSSILTEAEINATRLVKIDVEGAEWRVVSGMSDLLERGRDDLEVAVEVNPDTVRHDGRSCEDFLAFFRKFGFRPYQIENIYGDLSNACLSAVSCPRRIERIPDGKQSDVIFSRRDADVL